MTGRWYFHREDKTVVLRARFEGEDGTGGDARDEVSPGQKFLNLDYQQLFDAEGGVVVVGRNGRARIERQRTP